MVNLYNDHLRVQHGGSIDGFAASVSMLPNDGIGIVILTNNGASLVNVVDYYATDIMLGGEPVDRSAQLRGSGRHTEGKTDEDVPKTTHKLSDFAGKYNHPGYGTVAITLED